ncbi:MAG TPA: hypothetical protein VMS08_03475 [Candidatus Saccharimonadia bacterium]|nr:hypothetical protein [Candidatus Saccharimonadia bacterium]
MTIPEDPTNPLIIEGVSIGGTALATFIATYFWTKRNAASGKKIKDAMRLDDLERQLSLLNQTIQPISVAFQAILVKKLTHFHTPRLDELLKKVGPPFVLTSQEEVELVRGLKNRTDEVAPSIDENERIAAAMLPFVMTWIKFEREAVVMSHSLALVAIATEPEK